MFRKGRLHARSLCRGRCDSLLTGEKLTTLNRPIAISAFSEGSICTLLKYRLAINTNPVTVTAYVGLLMRRTSRV
ncbi:hypothetical protein PSPTOT1_5698 [Pseudomonas syringae pv. tomato T1]|nr:hypothetical protein PSPTOT1_5698 [Pseudomonas syringae pv. tomato T1]